MYFIQQKILPDSKKKTLSGSSFSCTKFISHFSDDGLNSRRFSFIKKFTDKILSSTFFGSSTSKVSFCIVE